MTGDAASKRVAVCDDRVSIRPARPSDRVAIRDLHAAVFPTDAEARLVDALRAGGRLRISLVAICGDRVVGHVAVSPVILDGTSDGVGLGPVSVLRTSRRRGVAARLVREVLAACQRSGRGFVVVLGDPAYYRRFGFEAARTWGLRGEYGGDEAFQALELRPGAIPRRGGLVRYVPEFAIVG